MLFRGALVLGVLACAIGHVLGSSPLSQMDWKTGDTANNKHKIHVEEDSDRETELDNTTRIWSINIQPRGGQSPNEAREIDEDHERDEAHEHHEETKTINGYRRFGKSLYKLVKSPGLTWWNALKSCRRDDGDLAVINSEEEADFLFSLFDMDNKPSENLVNEGFVGVTDVIDDGQFFTIEGYSLNSMGFNKWLPNEPNNGGGSYNANEDCVTFHRGRAYNDIVCDRPMPYFCEIHKETGNEIGEDSDRETKMRQELRRLLMKPQEEEGYRRLGNSSFKLVKSPTMSWWGARKSCKQDGGDLAVVNSQEEADFLLRLFYMDPTYLDLLVHGGFVGVVGVHGEGQFLTVDGVSLNSTSFPKWMSNEPDDGDRRYQNERCVIFHTGRAFIDIDCGRRMPYFCEINKETENEIGEDSDRETKMEQESRILLINKPTQQGGGQSANGVLEKEIKILKGYRSLGNSFFKLVIEPQLSWWDAHNSCKRDGGDLAVINSEEEAYFLYMLFYWDVAITDPVEFEGFVGVTDVLEAGQFLTVHGVSLNSTGFNKWIPNHPYIGDELNNQNEHCVTFCNARVFNDIDCDERKPYFCEINNETRNEIGEDSDWEIKMEQALRRSSVKIQQGGPSAYEVPEKDEETKTINGYRSLGNSSFKLVKVPPLSWWDAFNSCEHDGGDLAVINSQEEADFLLRIFNMDHSYGDSWVIDAFVGVTDVIKEGQFFTVDGVSLNSTGFNKWMPNEPNNGGGLSFQSEDCVTFHSTGAFNDVNCGRRMPYFCEINNETENKTENSDWETEMEQPPRSSSVKIQQGGGQSANEVREKDEKTKIIKGYRSLGNSSFKLVKVPRLSWSGAHNSCKQDGGDLAVIDSQEKADFLYKLFYMDFSYTDGLVYEGFVGVTDVLGGGHLITVHGVSLNPTGFNKWLPNEPNNGDGRRNQNEECVTFHKKSRAYKYADCDLLMPYFCEINNETGFQIQISEDSEQVIKLEQATTRQPVNILPRKGLSENEDREQDEDHEHDEDREQDEEPKTITGYRSLGKSLYKLVKGPGLSWSNARNSCRRDGGDLAVIHSEEEADFLFRLFNKDPKLIDALIYEGFVGITDELEEGQFITVDGSSLNSTGFNKWLPNEPNNGDGRRSKNEDCVTFHKGRAYNDIDCDRPMPFFCEIIEKTGIQVGENSDRETNLEQDITRPHAHNVLLRGGQSGNKDRGQDGEQNKTDEDRGQDEETKTLEGYRSFGKSLYKLEKYKRISWSDARKSCKGDGGDLAVINSQEEANFLSRQFYVNPSYIDLYIYEGFVGVTDEQEEGQFLTVDGVPLNSTGFNKWMPNEPSNGDGLRSQNEDCVTLHMVGRYRDVDCRRWMPYFCEIDKKTGASP